MRSALRQRWLEKRVGYARRMWQVQEGRTHRFIFCLICWSRVVRTGGFKRGMALEERCWSPVRCAVPREHSGKDGQRMLDGWVMTQVIWAKDATLGSLVGAQYGGQRAGWISPLSAPWPDVVFLEPTCTSMGEAQNLHFISKELTSGVPSQDKPPGEREPWRTILKGGTEWAWKELFRDGRHPWKDNVIKGKGEKIVKTDWNIDQIYGGGYLNPKRKHKLFNKWCWARWLTFDG